MGIFNKLFGSKKMSKTKLQPSGDNTALSVNVLDLDSRFRSISSELVQAMILNTGYQLLKEIKNKYPSYALVHLAETEPQDLSHHLTCVMGKDLGLILTLFVNPIKAQEITNYLKRRWIELVEYAYSIRPT